MEKQKLKNTDPQFDFIILTRFQNNHYFWDIMIGYGYRYFMVGYGYITLIIINNWITIRKLVEAKLFQNYETDK